MNKKPNDNVYKNVYPNFRHFMSLGRKTHQAAMNVKMKFGKRPEHSSVIPDNYSVCNTSTIDSDFDLKCIEGEYPNDLNGSLYITQCLGVPKAFMVGDTNIVRIDFDEQGVHLTNRLMWNPVAIAKLMLEKTKHRFDYFGLMFLSPGLGMFSYTEGMYLLPDGRLAITSDVDRPWVIDRDTLRVSTPIGRRDEWLPMMADKAGDVMGNLFAGYSNSHVLYTDHETSDVFMVNYQYKQADGSHPVNLMKWDGYGDFITYRVVNEEGFDIEVKQSIHELIFTKDYILLADTAFIAGTEMLTPWKNAPLPNEKTIVYIVNRRDLCDNQKVVAKRFEVDEPCIHLIAEYDNPESMITAYLLHTPATNTAEILKDYDRDLNGNLFSENVVGYGTLPVLDLSSVGKHCFDMKKNTLESSQYISQMPYCFGPYLYTYMGRQISPFNKQDLFVMFKGFSKDILPKRIYDAYKDVDNRRLDIKDMVDGKGIHHNNSICKIATDQFEITDGYVMPDKVLLYTIACLEVKDGGGYVIAGVVKDQEHAESSGHEYWLFDAKDLSKGPVCKLANKSLNNSTLFHTVYIPKEVDDKLNKKEVTYHVPLREDYPSEELNKWDPSVLKSFEEVIWPYYDQNHLNTNKIDKITADLSKRRITEHFGKEHLIGEEKIDDAGLHAEKMIEEVSRLWKTTGWKTEKNKSGFLVESKPVCGPFESSGVFVTRCVGEIEASARHTFEMLISPEGYAVIDPVSKPEDHKTEPLEVYNWKKGCRLEAALATTQIPLLKTSDFVVLNAIDPFEKIFVSKSIIHDALPGGSKYSNEESPSNGHVRALNTFAIKVEAVSENRCRVYSINYADMCGKTSASMNNLINTKAFFPPLYKRIVKAMDQIIYK